VIGFIDVGPELDRLLINSQKGHDRSTPPFHSKGREGLDMIPLVKKGNG
jgi:hypothetical protein